MKRDFYIEGYNWGFIEFYGMVLYWEKTSIIILYTNEKKIYI